jgi:hypothetical protein
MIPRLLFLLAIASVFFSCRKDAIFTVENPLNSARTDEVIVLTKSQVEQKLELKEGMLPVFKSVDGKVIPGQVDDLDGDGNWDEVALVVNFAAGESKEIKVNLVPVEEYPEFEKRTNLRLGIKQEDGSYAEVDNYRALPCNDGFEIIAQAESVNWENDKIGFRVYFDCRNVKDLFGKLKPDLIIDKIHTPELPNYHDLAEWGMDVLHCGSSLGSGGLAILKNDSLFRLGSTKVYEYQKTVEGPVRSIFELRYSGWNVNGELMEAVERVTIYPGKYWFESDVTFKGCSDEDQIVTGIVTSRLKRVPFEFKAGGFQCIGTHDAQSLNNDELGMAVIVPLAETGKIGRTTDINFFKLGYETVVEKGFSNIISETYYIGQKCKNNVPAKHYFFSVWGLDNEQWKTEDGFRKYITQEAEKLSSPMVVN